MNDMTADGASAEVLIRALGGGVVEIWAALPRETQEMIFEHAVHAGHRGERDESLRERLAAFLHERHPRTAAEEGENAGGAPVGR
jgi:hypothetical protein